MVNFLSFIGILLSFSLVNGFDYTTRCLYFNKSCVVRCPRLMHPYHTRCDRDTMSQRTCEEPIVRPIGFSCGWSRCDCNGELVLDEQLQTCVEHEDCTFKPQRKKATKARSGRRKLTKKVVMDEDTDLIDMK